MKLISKAEFSRLCGVSQPAIAKAIKNKLAPAFVNGKIDISNEAAIEYKNSKHKKKAVEVVVETEIKTASENVDLAVADVDIDMADINNWRIGDLVEKFGTDEGFKNWTTARKTIEEIKYKELKNKELAGELIMREMVAKYVFGSIDATQIRLLTDTPRTIAMRVYALANSDTDIEEAEALVTELISKQLKDLKAKTKKTLEGL